MSDLSKALAPIKARADAATPGPWRAGRSDMTSYGGYDGEPFKNVYGPNKYEHPNIPGEMVPESVARGETDLCHENAAFIAHARQDIPTLIAVIEKLDAALREFQTCAWDEIEGQPMARVGRTPSGLGSVLVAPAEIARQARGEAAKMMEETRHLQPGETAVDTATEK